MGCFDTGAVRSFQFQLRGSFYFGVFLRVATSKKLGFNNF